MDDPTYRTFRLGPLVGCIYGGTDAWVRLFGWGVSVQRPAHPDGYVSFSERYGYQRTWHVSGACVQILPSRERKAPVAQPARGTALKTPKGAGSTPAGGTS